MQLHYAKHRTSHAGDKYLILCLFFLMSLHFASCSPLLLVIDICEATSKHLLLSCPPTGRPQVRAAVASRSEASLALTQSC